MPSSLAEIRAAFSTTLDGLGLRVYSNIVDVVATPACVVDMAQTPSISYTGAMHMGGDEYYFDLFVMVANTDTRNALNVLDGYVTGQGVKSIRQALFADLGLDDVSCMATGVRSYGITTELAGIKMIGAIMRVCVTVT